MSFSSAKKSIGASAIFFLSMYVISQENSIVSKSLMGREDSDLEFAASSTTSPLGPSILGIEQELEELMFDHEEDVKKIASLQEQLKTEQEKTATMSDLQKQLEDTKSEFDTLQEQLKTEQEKTATMSDLQKQLEDTKSEFDIFKASSEGGQISDPASSVFEPNEICYHFQSKERPSATVLWQKYIPQILEASHNVAVPESETDEVFATFKEILESMVPPSRLRRSVRHMPTFSDLILKRVFDILQKRIQDPENNPPLKIAVFGGSVTLGRDCEPRRMQHKLCAWPNRFQLLVNQFFNIEVIQVFNLAVGGTGTGTGTNRVKYWMYNDEALKQSGPDVIINSYSTNDSLPAWGKTWPEDDLITISNESIRTQLQDFIRVSLQSKSCHTPPLVVHVDDYVGPQHKPLLGELTYVSVMTQLAKYYDTFGISYGEVVRDLVYEGKSNGIFANPEDVHFGHFAHQTIAWSVAFACLDLVITYCDDEYNARTVPREKISEGASLTKDDMRVQKLYLPPILDREFLSADATTKFDAAVNEAHEFYVENNCAAVAGEAKGDFNPCIVAWISTPGDFNFKQIVSFMSEHAIARDGWMHEHQNDEGWSNKDGWIANKANASFTLQFENIAKDVKTTTFYFLRSYGEKWKDSRARFTVFRVPPNSEPIAVGQHEIAGVHEDEDYHYSITMSEGISLSEGVLEGETLQIKVDLISGTHFKMMGMMLCNT